MQRAYVDHVKVIALTWSARASAEELRLRADDSGYLGNRAHAVALLRRAGCPDPERDVDELITARVFDEVDGGRLRCHDWDDWQARYRGPSDEPEAVAERVRRHRDVARVTTGNDSLRQETTGNARSLESNHIESSEGLVVVSPLPPAERGADVPNPRAAGTNPRAAGRRLEADAKRDREERDRRKRLRDLAYHEGRISWEEHRQLTDVDGVPEPGPSPFPNGHRDDVDDLFGSVTP
jgi:hypothetical protein